MMIAAVITSARQSEQQLQFISQSRVLRPYATALIAGAWGYCVSGSFLTQGFTWPLYILIALTAGLQKITAQETERYAAQGDCRSCADKIEDRTRAPYIGRHDG
jgi:hypothetical protein